MNKRGFTLLETIIAMVLSIGSITILFVIPKRMMDAQASYRHEVQKNLTHSTITLYLNDDLSHGVKPVETDKGFDVGNVEYILKDGALNRVDNNSTIKLNEVSVGIESDNDFILIKETDIADNLNPKEQLNIKIPLTSRYYLEGGMLNE